MIRRKSEDEMVDDGETDFDHEMVVDSETEFEQLFVDNGISDIF